MASYIMTLDVGGTGIKYGAVSPEGELLKAYTTPTRTNDGPDKLWEVVTGCIDRTTAEFGASPVGIGLGLSGGIDPDKGVVLLPGKFKALEGYPIVPMLREKYRLPVWADNDGRLAAYAEKYFGLAREQDWAVVVTLGTGVGSGVILDGRILADPTFLAGTQVGHVVINKSDDRSCLTGNAGTGEILCSSTALALQVRSAIQRGIPSVLTDAFHADPRSIDFRRIAEACRGGDVLCQRELGVWTGNLAVMLVNAIHSYQPGLIILSGGATHGADLYLHTLREIVNRQAFTYPKGRLIDIQVSALLEYAGLLGAAAMLMERLKH